MVDIFDAKIFCRKCNKEMKPIVVEKRGMNLRAVSCPKCGEEIIHPNDKGCLDHYNRLKGKTFNVKLRMVGNSHAISIPKEIVDFFNEQHKQMKKEMDDMVKLCFEDFKKLRLIFGEEE